MDCTECAMKGYACKTCFNYSRFYLKPASPELDSLSKKYDNEKLRFDLIPPIAAKALATILTLGATKYGENNWQELDDFEARYTGALMRHLNAWRLGEKTDPESGHPHLWHALCNIVFLIWREDKE